MPVHAILLDLTFQEVLADIPHDAGALIVLILLAGFVAFIWWGSRPSTVQKYAGQSLDPSLVGGSSSPSAPAPSAARQAEGDL